MKLSFICRYFLRTYLLNCLKVSAVLFGLSVLAVRSRISGFEESVTFVWMIVPFFFAGVFSSVTYSKNISWITSLPISKRRLISEVLLSNILIGVFSTGVSIFALLVLMNMHSPGGPVSTAPLLKLVTELNILSVVAYGTTAFLLLFVISIPKRLERIQLAALSRVTLPLRERVRRREFVILTILVIAWWSFSSELFFVLASNALILFQAYRMLDLTFGFQPKERIFAIRTFSAVWIAVTLLTSAVLLRELQSPNTAVALRANDFLPDGWGHWSEDRILSLIENSKEDSDRNTLMEMLRTAYYPGRNIPGSLAKRFPASLFTGEHLSSATVTAFDWKTLSPELRGNLYLQVSDSSSRAPEQSRAYGQWATLPLTDSELRGLFSKDLLGIRAALTWIEFHPKREYAEMILGGVFRNSLLQGVDREYVYIDALKTLSLVQGTLLKSEDIFAYLNSGKPLPVRDEPIDCAPLLAAWTKPVPRNLRGGEPLLTIPAPSKDRGRDEVVENYCHRQKAYAEWTSEKPKYSEGRIGWARVR